MKRELIEERNLKGQLRGLLSPAGDQTTNKGDTFDQKKSKHKYTNNEQPTEKTRSNEVQQFVYVLGGRREKILFN